MSLTRQHSTDHDRARISSMTSRDFQFEYKAHQFKVLVCWRVTQRLVDLSASDCSGNAPFAGTLQASDSYHERSSRSRPKTESGWPGPPELASSQGAQAVPYKQALGLAKSLVMASPSFSSTWPSLYATERPASPLCNCATK